MLSTTFDQALEFIACTAPFGVEEVRSTRESGAVYVVVGSDTGDENRLLVKLLARCKWPGRPVVLTDQRAAREDAAGATRTPR